MIAPPPRTSTPSNDKIAAERDALSGAASDATDAYAAEYDAEGSGAEAPASAYATRWGRSQGQMKGGTRGARKNQG